VITLERTFAPEPRNLVGAAVVVALALGCVWALRSGALKLRRPATVAVAAAGLVALALAGYLHERHYDRERYTGRSAAVDWVLANAPSGHEIGLTGNWTADRFVPIYPLFGPRLENEVDYVGPLVDEQVRYYTDAAAFRRAVEREDYDLLAVGTLSRPDFEDFETQRRNADPIEARWAEQAGYVEVARDDDFVLLERESGAG
jgi:hypothetical protein